MIVRFLGTAALTAALALPATPAWAQVGPGVAGSFVPEADLF
jgi:hypothetical protein